MKKLTVETSIINFIKEENLAMNHCINLKNMKAHLEDGVIKYVCDEANIIYYVFKGEDDFKIINSFIKSYGNITRLFESSYLYPYEKTASLLATFNNRKELLDFERIVTTDTLYFDFQEIIFKLNTYFDISSVSIDDFFLDKEGKVLFKINRLKKLKPRKICNCDPEENKYETCSYCGGIITPSLEYFIHHNHWNVCQDCLAEHK